MSTETIDVVINPPTAGARQVVRDINDIANAAINANTRLQTLQASINGLGRGSGLSQFQTQLNAVSTQLSGLNRQLQQMQSNMGNMGSSATGASGISSLTGAIRGLMGALSVKQIAEWSDAWTRAQGKIQALAPSMADATVVMQQLFEIAQGSRQPLEKVTQLYHLMSVSAKDLGASQAQMLQVTQTVSKLLVVQGVSTANAQRVMVQFAEALSTGKVQGQQFNSMMKTFPLILKVAAQEVDGAHGSIGKLKEMMKEGKLTSEVFFQAILKGGKDVDEMFQRAPQTFAQGWTVLTNGLERFIGKLNEASDASKGFVSFAQSMSDQLNTMADNKGPQMKIGTDGLATLEDFVRVVTDDIKTKFKGAWDYLSQLFGPRAEELGQGLANTMHITFQDIVMTWAKFLDAGTAGMTGFHDAVVAGFEGLPTVIDQIGKQMFNSLIGWIEKIINGIVDALNKISSFTGQSMLSHLQIARAQVDDGVLKNYGRKVSDAFQAGFQSEDGKMQTYFKSVFDRASQLGFNRVREQFRKSEITAGNANLDATGKPEPLAPDQKALNRAAMDAKKALDEMFQAYQEKAAKMQEIERHKEEMLKASYDAGALDYKNYLNTLATLQDQDFTAQAELLRTTMSDLEGQYDKTYAALKAKGATKQELLNFTQDYETKVNKLTDSLDKLKNKQEEVLAQRTAQVAKPIAEFVSNMQKTIALDDTNLKQEMEKIDAKKNLNGLDEKSLYIQQELLRLTGPYEDALSKVNSELAKAKADGLFESDSEIIQQRLLDLVNLGAKLETKIQSIKKTAPEALGEAFDAAKADAFGKELSSGLADALVTGGREGGKKLRQVLQDELIKKPFTMLLQAILQPLTNAIGQMLVGAVNGGGESSILNLFKGGGGADSLGSVARGGGTGLFGGYGGFEDTVFNMGSTLNQNGFEGIGNFMMDNSGGISALGSGLSYLGALNSASQGKWGSAIGTAAGTFFGGPIGGFLGGTIGSIFDPEQHGPKEGAYFGAGTANPSGGYVGQGDAPNSAIATDLMSRINAFNRNVNEMISNLGGINKNYKLGLGASTDPKGTAPSFVEATVRDAHGVPIYSNVNTNVGRSSEELAFELTKQTTNAMVAALDNSGIDHAYIDYFHRVADGLDDQGKQDTLKTIVDISALTKAIRDMGDVFSNAVPMTVDMKAALIEYAGGVDKLTSGMNAYFNNFFTASEKHDAMARGINSTLAQAGVNFDAANGTRQQFRDLAQSLDLSTESGQKAYAAMMSVAQAFADLTTSSDNASAAMARLDTLRGALTSGYQQEHSKIMDVITAIEAWRDKMVDFRASLVQGSNSAYTPTERYQLAKQDYSNTTSDLLSGDPTKQAAAQQRWETVAQAFLSASRTVNASSDAYTADFQQVLKDSGSSQGLGDQQYQVEVDQLKQLDNAVANLTNVNNSVLSVRDAIIQLETTVGASLNPNGTVQGLYSSILGRGASSDEVGYWADKLRGGATIADVRAGFYGSQEYLSQNGPQGAISQLYQTILGRSPDQGGLDYWMQQYNSGMSIAQISSAFRNSPEFQGLPGHAAGLGYVPHDNYLARLHYGEAVLSQPQANIWRHGMSGMDMNPVTQGLMAVHQELSAMREQQQAAVHAEIASNEKALERNAQKVGDKVADAQGRQNFKDRARQRHRIA